MDQQLTNWRLLRIRAVCELTSLSRATIYRLVDDEKFPKPLRISTNRVGWCERSVVEWIASRGS